MNTFSFCRIQVTISHQPQMYLLVKVLTDQILQYLSDDIFPLPLHTQEVKVKTNGQRPKTNLSVYKWKET